MTMVAELSMGVGNSHTLEQRITTLIYRFSPYLATAYKNYLTPDITKETVLDFWVEVLFYVEEQFPSENTLPHRMYLRDSLNDTAAFLRYFEERVIPLIVKYRLPNNEFKYPVTKR